MIASITLFIAGILVVAQTVVMCGLPRATTPLQAALSYTAASMAVFPLEAIESNNPAAFEVVLLIGLVTCLAWVLSAGWGEAKA